MTGALLAMPSRVSVLAATSYQLSSRGNGGRPMESNNLWMDVHRLYSTMDQLGTNREERIDAAVAEFMQLPPTVRRELHSDIRRLAVDLFAMLPIIAAVENGAGHGKKKTSGAA